MDFKYVPLESPTRPLQKLSLEAFIFYVSRDTCAGQVLVLFFCMLFPLSQKTLAWDVMLWEIAGVTRHKG